jgi:hypothetical protein
MFVVQEGLNKALSLCSWMAVVCLSPKEKTVHTKVLIFNSLRRQNNLFYSKAHFVPRSKQSPFRLWQDRQCTYKAILLRVRLTTVVVEKMYYIFWVCMFVSLVVQHATRMCYILLSSVACPTAKYSSKFYHKRPNFRRWWGGESYWTQNVCFNIHYGFCPKHFSL